MFQIWHTYSILVAGINVRAKDFKVVFFKNEEDLYCFICRFKKEYNPRNIEIKCTKKIENIYLAMKENLKKCIYFDQSIGNF